MSPSEIPQFIYYSIGVFLFIVGAIAWLLRLENKVGNAHEKGNKLEADHKALEVKIDATESKIFEKLSIIERSLAKIEGRLSVETTTK